MGLYVGKWLEIEIKTIKKQSVFGVHCHLIHNDINYINILLQLNYN